MRSPEQLVRALPYMRHPEQLVRAVSYMRPPEQLVCALLYMRPPEQLFRQEAKGFGRYVVKSLKLRI